MRIFYAVPDFFPPWRLDVHELFTLQMPLHGVDVSWSMRRNSPGLCTTTNHNGQKVFLPIRVAINSITGKAFNRLLQFICEAILFLRLLFGPHYDIIQIRDKRYLFAFFGWIIARIRGSKFVFWSSYPFPEFLLEMASIRQGKQSAILFLRGHLSWFYLYRFIMRVADHIFVQSEQMRTDLTGYGISSEKMTVVPMGVPLSLLNKRDTHQSNEIRPGKIVYTGTFARVRRLTVIIEAFAVVKKHNSSACLYMVGAGETPEERIELENLAKELNIADSVIFTGFLPMTEAWNHAETAEICLSPFFPTFVLRSTSPTKLIEYMALGRPVVANDHPEQAEIIKETGAGICVPWGANTFADAIIELLENPDRARSMGEKGPTWILNNRTYDIIANQLFTQYLSLTNK